MSPQRREIRSGYIEWAKLRSKSRYNLATSDVVHLTLADLHPSIADLELSGADGLCILFAGVPVYFLFRGRAVRPPGSE